MTNTATSQLRQRMIEDMTLRGFSPGTQRGYIAAVRNFTDFLGRRPDQGMGRTCGAISFTCDQAARRRGR